MMELLGSWLAGISPTVGIIAVILLAVIYSVHFLVMFRFESQEARDQLQLKVVDMVSHGLDDIKKLQNEVDETRARVTSLEASLRDIQSKSFFAAGVLGTWLVKYPPSEESIKDMRDHLIQVSQGRE